ncbi:centromere protein I [Spea bombifrons]|uniref:centromere protein I n=1 Tax=Spea bombifrons TaxID=233779 RepID=UPI00234B414D|nr:centromere protein I [Spea bombifrons]
MEGQQYIQETRMSGQQDSNIQQLKEALQYFKNVDSKVSVKGNLVLSAHLTSVEDFGMQNGIPPDGVDVLLELALSGKLADSVNTRLLKCLLPASEVLQSSIIKGVSLFCAAKCSASVQSLFIRWLISVFDLIPCKDALSSLYNFFFYYLQDEKLCPYLCHLLYLITKKDHVRPFRVRKLLELQSRKGLYPPLIGLLSLYKIFCPEMVLVSLPSRVKNYFKSSHLLWTSELRAVTRRNAGHPTMDHILNVGGKEHPLANSRKRKWNSKLPQSACSDVWSAVPFIDNHLMSSNQVFPLEKLQTFTQLLENIHQLELPAQMGSVLKNPLLLHYVNCIKDDTLFLRLNYWLAFTLHEECSWFLGKKHNEEVEVFLETVVKTQKFLQEGLSSTEEFLYKYLPHWNGSLRSQILKLITWIPINSSSELEMLLYEPLAQLFAGSTLFFKCSVLESMKGLLQNWLVWHSVCAEEVHSNGANNHTMSGLLTAIEDLIQFTGRLCTLGLQIQSSSLLLHFILDFYEIVCDMYTQFDLPLVVLPPPGVFYPALLSTDSVNLDRLCYIMYRYRTNLVTVKDNERHKRGKIYLNISSQTFQEYNRYLTAMVGCLWTSQAFLQDTHPQGIRLEQEVLASTGVPYYKKAFNIVYHPALVGYSSSFLHQRFPEDRMFQLHLIKGQRWNTYLDFLYSEGMNGLRLFIESSVNRVSSSSQQEPSDLALSQP